MNLFIYFSSVCIDGIFFLHLFIYLFSMFVWMGLVSTWTYLRVHADRVLPHVDVIKTCPQGGWGRLDDESGQTDEMEIRTIIST